VKLTFFRVLKIGIALGAGLEFGKVLPHVASQLILKSDFREQVRRQYRAGVKYQEERARTMRVVPDDIT